MLSPSLCFGFCFVVLWRGGKGATEESFYILLSDWRQLKPCMDILQDPWSMKQNFREISLETLDTWDFVGFFLNCTCFVFSPATSQEGVEQPARPQELSRAHVLTSSRRRGSHLNIYRIYSMLFDVWYIYRCLFDMLRFTTDHGHRVTQYWLRILRDEAKWLAKRLNGKKS